MEEATNVHNQSIIYKGKRTKRLRPLSPVSYALPTNSQQQQVVFPTSSLEFGTEATEEEEDMANCLILLAQGHFSNPLPRQVEDQGYKYSSRRYMPAADTAGAGKAGYCVYQCKTCDRTFSSFQALGGHRASHKKPKGGAGEEQQKRQRHHEEEGQFMGMGSSLSLQLTNNNNNNNNSKVGGNGNKVHECWICGAEFTSGQALGGHMRRHRGTISATALTLTPADYSGSGEQQQQQPIGINNNNNKKAVSLDLDLNLPAPPEDQQQPNFIFAASHQQKPPLLLSASALVDCHY